MRCLRYQPLAEERSVYRISLRARPFSGRDTEIGERGKEIREGGRLQQLFKNLFSCNCHIRFLCNDKERSATDETSE